MSPAELDDLRQGLRDIADQPRPIRIDIAAVRARGRRTVRTRRITAAAGSAAAIAVVAALTLEVLPGGPPRGPAPVGAPVRPHPVRPNPFLARASFGWLPPGWQIIDSQAGREAVGAAAAPAQGYSVSAQRVPAKDDGVHQVILTVFPPGPEPAMGFMRGAVPAKAIPAGPVNGHRAHWLQPPPPGAGTAAGEARLRIQYGGDQWAELEINDVPAAGDVVAMLYQIARSIRLQTTPMAFPIKITGLPSAFAPSWADVQTIKSSSVGWSTTLSFTPGLLGVTAELPGDVSPGTRRSFVGGRHATNTTIGGHLAYYLDPAQMAALEDQARKATHGGAPVPAQGGREPSERLCVYDVNGLDICFEARGPAVTALAPLGGLPGLYRRTTVLGPDQRHWTTDPLG